MHTHTPHHSFSKQVLLDFWETKYFHILFDYWKVGVAVWSCAMLLILAFLFYCLVFRFMCGGPSIRVYVCVSFCQRGAVQGRDWRRVVAASVWWLCVWVREEWYGVFCVPDNTKPIANDCKRLSASPLFAFLNTLFFLISPFATINDKVDEVSSGDSKHKQ